MDWAGQEFPIHLEETVTSQKQAGVIYLLFSPHENLPGNEFNEFQCNVPI